MVLQWIVLYNPKGAMRLSRKYISAVKPLDDHILQVDFVSGSRLLLDMKPYLDKLRFRPLADPQLWNSAVTNGIFIRFGSVELINANKELFKAIYAFNNTESFVMRYNNHPTANAICDPHRRELIMEVGADNQLTDIFKKRVNSKP